MNSEVTASSIPQKPTLPFDKRDRAFSVVFLLLSLLFANFSLIGSFHMGFAVSLCLVVMAVQIYLKKQLCYNAFNLTCLISAYVCAASFAVYGDYEISLFGFAKFVFIGIALSLFLVSAAGFKSPKIEDFRGLLAPFFLFFCHSVPSISITVRSAGSEKKKGISSALKIALGVLIATPAFIIVTSLLASADAAFMNVIDRIDFSFVNAFVTLFFGIPAFIFLFPLLFSAKSRYTTEKESKRKPYAQILDSVTVNTVLVLISAIYVLYVFSQLSYLIGGISGVLPEDMTFSAYAKRGFGEMCAVCLINIICIFTANALVRRKDGCSLPRFTGILIIFISAFSMFLVVTAIAKMFMYIGSYGLTFLRLGTSVFMLFLFFVFIALIIKVLNRSFRHIKFIATVGCVIIALASVCDINTVCINYNMYAYESGMHEKIDVSYLGVCGKAAVPSLIKLAKGNDPKISEQAYRELYYIGYGFSVEKDFDIRSTTVEEIIADRLLSDNAEAIIAGSGRHTER